MGVVRARMEEHQWDRLHRNLGPFIAYGFYQPEQSHYKLDLEQKDDRILASLMVQLAIAEDNKQIFNIREPVLDFPDGKKFDFLIGVPPSWQKASELPPAGTFKFRYMCSPEDRRLERRKDLGASYGDWRCKVDHESVSWWMSLWGVPAGVVRLLHCSLRTFASMEKCFNYLDAPINNGELNLVKLRTRTKKLGWKELEDESILREVFRYLDPNGGGSISKDEWSMMDQLWEELQLRIFEFLTFIDRTYDGDFDEAFDDIDIDGNASIDHKEWEKVIRSVGFYGPSLAIFSYAADAGEGEQRRITREGWAKLQSLYEKGEEKLFDKG